MIELLRTFEDFGLNDDSGLIYYMRKLAWCLGLVVAFRSLRRKTTRISWGLHTLALFPLEYLCPKIRYRRRQSARGDREQSWLLSVESQPLRKGCKTSAGSRIALGRDSSGERQQYFVATGLEQVSVGT